MASIPQPICKALKTITALQINGDIPVIEANLILADLQLTANLPDLDGLIGDITVEGCE